MTDPHPDPAHDDRDSPVRSTFRVLAELGPVAALGAWAAAIPAVGGFVILGSAAASAGWLREHEPWSVIAFAIGFALLSGFAVIPTYATAFAAGWAFHLTGGGLAAMAGCLGGSAIGYALASRIAPAHVDAVLERRPTWLAVRNAIVGAGDRPTLGSPAWWRSLGGVTLIRLPPNSPFALTNLVLASCRVPVSTFLLGTLVGMAPRTLLVVWLGDQGQALLAEELGAVKPPLWLVGAGLASAVVVLLVLGKIAGAALDRMAATANGAGPTPKNHPEQGGHDPSPLT